jgi:hypothetical protein
VPAFTATEVDPDRLAHLRSRFAGDPRVTVRSIDIFHPEPADYSSYLAFNVLEHIPDQVAALRAAHTLVRPGDAVVMFVPAFEFAMSRFDRAVGGRRPAAGPGQAGDPAGAALGAAAPAPVRPVRVRGRPGAAAVVGRLTQGDALAWCRDDHDASASERRPLRPCR